MPLKVTSWNIEHAQQLIGPNPSANVLKRRQRIRATLDEIAPDVLCVQEGPKGEVGIDAFCTDVLGRQWLPVLLRPADAPLGVGDSAYQTSGTQWIWFLVRPALVSQCRLQAPTVWQAFTGGRRWTVNFWGQRQPTDHAHYRHPQVMIYRLQNGLEVEFIGVHLKSKINRNPIQRDDRGNLTGLHLDEALEARVKLATEARDIRRYIGAKFDQTARPGILVMGDCNDGPGQDFFETQYLFFDLIANIQGDVLVAERFFNHALFDWPANLRWTARYRDELLGLTAAQNPLLLDHILISQPLVRGDLPLVVHAGAGKVEHEAYERHNAGATGQTRTSDHRPSSCLLSDIS